MGYHFADPKGYLSPPPKGINTYHVQKDTDLFTSKGVILPTSKGKPFFSKPKGYKVFTSKGSHICISHPKGYHSSHIRRDTIVSTCQGHNASSGRHLKKHLGKAYPLNLSLKHAVGNYLIRSKHYHLQLFLEGV